MIAGRKQAGICRISLKTGCYDKRAGHSANSNSLKPIINKGVNRLDTHSIGPDKKAYSIHTTSGMDMDGLIKAIRHPNLGIRWRAALALGDFGEPAIKPLIRAMRENDHDVRWLAGLALGHIGERATPPS